MPSPSPCRVEPKFAGQPAIVVATGPSLTAGVMAEVMRLHVRHLARVFIMNNLYLDIECADVHTACDPEWWATYGDDPGLVMHRAEKWTWNPEVAMRYNVRWIPGRWGDGLSLDPSFIHYGHSSGYQLLNLAVLYGCDPIYLVGFDMRYEPGKRRHFFEGLSDISGEYPRHLRKYSTFDGLIKCYETVAMQKNLNVEIINCTQGSAMHWFPFGTLEELWKRPCTPTA